jgi:O-antigen/teichoic acid export membrane protein
MTSLGAETVIGVKWSTLSQGGRQIIQLITTIVLTRLLSPSDFGVISMAAVVTGFLSLFHDLGTSAAVIQKRMVSEIFLSSIFWVNAVFGLSVAFGLYLCAPLVADFYKEPNVASVLKVLSLSFLIAGFGIVQQAIMERDLAFGKLAKIELIASLSSALLGIGLACLGARVWSLVYQALMLATVTTALLWVSSGWRPKKFKMGELASVARFSLNLTGFNVFNYFARNADYIVIGRFLGAQDLGYYTMAYRIMLFPIQTISTVIGRVTFPVYSRIQEDNAVFRRIYLKATGAIALISFPMMIGLWGIAEPFVLTVLGPKWEPVVLLILILSPVGLVQSTITTVGAIYQAKGRSDLLLRVGALTGVITIVAFIIGVQWGMIGVAVTYAIATGVCMYPNFIIPFRLIDLDFLDLARGVFRPLVCSFMMLSFILGLKPVCLKHISDEWALSILISIGVITYASGSWVVNRFQIRQVIGLAFGK